MAADVKWPFGLLDRKLDADLLSFLPFSATMQKRKWPRAFPAPRPRQMPSPSLARTKNKSGYILTDTRTQAYTLIIQPICWRRSSPACPAIGRAANVTTLLHFVY